MSEAEAGPAHLAASHADLDVAMVTPLSSPTVLDNPVVPVCGINAVCGGLLRTLHTVANSLQTNTKEGVQCLSARGKKMLSVRSIDAVCGGDISTLHTVSDSLQACVTARAHSSQHHSRSQGSILRPPRHQQANGGRARSEHHQSKQGHKGPCALPHTVTGILHEGTELMLNSPRPNLCAGAADHQLKPSIEAASTHQDTVVELLSALLVIKHTSHVQLEGALVSLNRNSHRLPADRQRVTSKQGACVSNTHRVVCALSRARATASIVHEPLDHRVRMVGPNNCSRIERTLLTC